MTTRASSPSQKTRQQGSVFNQLHAVNMNPSAQLQNSNIAPVAVDVPKNARGGVLVTQSEVQAMFSLLDSDKSGSISLANLKKKIGVFFPEMTAKDFRFLMNNKKELSLDDFKELLIDNDISNFDPAAEAFKLFDPKGEGAVNIRKLREVFETFGFGEISDEEMSILMKVLCLFL